MQTINVIKAIALWLIDRYFLKLSSFREGNEHLLVTTRLDEIDDDVRFFRISNKDFNGYDDEKKHLKFEQ